VHPYSDQTFHHAARGIVVNRDALLNCCNGSIIGVSQTGNMITFASLKNNGFDQRSPVDQ